MARYFTASNSQYLDIGRTIYTTGLVGQSAVSISAVIRPQLINNHQLLSIHSCDSTKGLAAFGIGTSSRGFIGGRSINTDGFQQTSTDNALTAGISYIMSGYMDLATSTARLWLNGIPQTQATQLSFGQTVFANETPYYTSKIGCNPSGLVQFYDGTAAELAIWNRRLSDAEFEALGKRYTPERVSRHGLIGYWPLMGRFSPEPDLSPIGANGLPSASSPSYSDHPPVIGVNRMRAAVGATA